MARERPRNRRDVLAGLAALAASGCSPTPDRTQRVVEIVTTPGDLAASADLRWLALNDWNDDFSAIGVCDLQLGTVEVLHAARRATLRPGGFSPRGDSLAFTATPFGKDDASLFVVSLADGVPRLIGRRVTYRGPSFSPDGQRILAFGGDAAFRPYQLMEIDLASGVENLAWTGAFAAGWRTAYDPLGPDYLVAAHGPADAVGLADDWRSLDYDGKHGSPRAFRVPGGGGAARPIAAARDVGEAAEFRGVTASGEALLHSFRTGVDYRAMLVSRAGRARTIWWTDVSEIPSGVAVSSDGARVLTARYLLDAKGDSLARYEIVSGATGGGDRVRRLSSDFRSRPRQLELDDA